MPQIQQVERRQPHGHPWRLVLVSARPRGSQHVLNQFADLAFYQRVCALVRRKMLDRITSQARDGLRRGLHRCRHTLDKFRLRVEMCRDRRGRAVLKENGRIELTPEPFIEPMPQVQQIERRQPHRHPRCIVLVSSHPGRPQHLLNRLPHLAPDHYPGRRHHGRIEFFRRLHCGIANIRIFDQNTRSFIRRVFWAKP
ncbi:hypothetical protein BOTU111921_13645 [Bordetella tumbae]